MLKLSPLTIRRINNFKSNKRGVISSYVFLSLFLISLFANFIANDKPIFVKFNDNYYFPIFEKIPEIFYGGEFETEADYKDPYVIDLIKSDGFLIMPLIEYSFDTINYDLKLP